MAEISKETIAHLGKMTKHQKIVVVDRPALLHTMYTGVGSALKSAGCDFDVISYMGDDRADDPELVGKELPAGTKTMHSVAEIAAYITDPANGVEGVITGQGLPTFYGNDLAKALRAQRFHGPVALLTSGTPTPSQVLDVKQLGAQGLYNRRDMARGDTHGKDALFEVRTAINQQRQGPSL